MGRKAIPIEDRFHKHYIPITESGCWIWIGKTTSGHGSTYGSVKMGTILGGDRRTALAHRVSYELYTGPIPDGSQVLHECDVPLCVNPAHLFLGTHEDNMNDMLAKDRSCRGERNGHAVLSEKDVLFIRCTSESIKELALKYGISASAIRKARSGYTWRYI